MAPDRNAHKRRKLARYSDFPRVRGPKRTVLTAGQNPVCTAPRPGGSGKGTGTIHARGNLIYGDDKLPETKTLTDC